MAAVLIKIKGCAKRWRMVYNGHRGIIGRAREGEMDIARVKKERQRNGQQQTSF